VLEFSEVEGGIFEAPRPGEGILFIQQSAKAGAAPRSAGQAIGDWSIVRGDKPICVLTLTDTASGGEFAIRVKPPCDRFVTRFGPATWQIDRGELVMKSARDQFWRFEAIENSNWRLVPESANPVLLVRK
jgi:Protease inhibitor Inh